MGNVVKIYFDIPDSEKNRCGIYAIKNIRNGKVYIGSAINLKDRFKQHKSYLFSGRHTNQKLLRAYNKAGEKELAFRIIEFCSIEDRLSVEQKWIDYYDCVEKGYNILTKAGSNLGYKHSPDNVKQRNETRKQKGWFISDATREKRKQLMSEALKGRKFSEDTLEKMRIAAKKRMTPKMREKISKSNIGKPGPNSGRIFGEQTRKICRKQQSVVMQIKIKLCLLW